MRYRETRGCWSTLAHIDKGRLALLITCLTLLCATPVRAVEFGNIEVVTDASNNPTSVTMPQRTPDINMYMYNFGDFHVQVGASPADDIYTGVAIASVREHVRDGRAATCETNRHTSSGSWWISMSPAPAGGEWNLNVAAAFFPVAEGWQTARASGTTVNVGSFAGALTNPGTGVYNLALTGVNTLSDGILLANASSNSDNYAMAGPAADGSNFVIKTHDNGVNGGTFEQQPIAFAYIPYDTPGVVSGRVSGEGGLYSKSGDFSIQRTGTGTFRLDIPGHTPTSGALLVTGDTFGAANDNIVSYAPAGSGWEIQTRDLTGVGPQDLIGQAVFQFAFMPFASPPTAPGGRTFDPTAQVAAANIEVIQHTTGAGADALHAQMTEGTGFLTIPYWNRGDFQFRQNGLPVDDSAGVLMATVSEDKRSNAGEAADGIGVANVNSGVAFGGASLPGTATSRSANNYSGGEFNVNHSVAYFPYAAGFQGDTDVPTSGGTTTVTLAGTRDTRYDGPLFVVAAGNDNNLAAAMPTSDGSGWTVDVRNYNSGLTSSPFNYVFLPYGTENLIAGEVARANSTKKELGHLINKAGNFSFFREGTGLYRLSIPGGSPTQGMLLLTGTSDGGNEDDVFTYEADGNDFLIHCYDTGNAEPIAEDCHFSFAYVSFDNPPANPQLRPDLSKSVSAANLEVIQTGGHDAVFVNTVQSSPGFTCPLSNGGDYHLNIDGRQIDLPNGVMLASVRENGRGGVYATVEATQYTNLSYPAWTAVGAVGSGGETNMNVAAAYFPFAGGWTSGHVNAAGTLWASSNNIDSSMLSKIADGRWRIDIPDVDSTTDGLLFAVGGANSNRVVTAGVVESGGNQGNWEIAIRANTQDGGSYTQSDFSFLYVPFEPLEGLVAANLIGGRVDESGSLLQEMGDFDLTHRATGQYELVIPGESPETGMLLLTVAKIWNTGMVEDNYLSYEPYGTDGTHFLIQSRDLPGTNLQDTDFVFAFIKFGDPPVMVPEPAGLVLLALGGLALVALRRRRRR